jgi:plastocyanin
MDRITDDLAALHARISAMTLSRALLPLAGTLALALSGCGSSSSSHSSSAAASSGSAASSTAASSRTAASATAGSSPAAAHSAHVAISGYAFHPATVTVASGAKVTFTNSDQTNHTATANGGAFDTGTLAQGARKTVILKKAGTYTYFCQFHAFMKATLVVK